MSTYNINPVVVRMKESDKGIIYQSVVALGMRARQINDDIKYEIQRRMSDIVIDTNENEAPNIDQINISREFDYLRKPTFMAMKEIFEEKLHFSFPEPVE
jgi:DNA-directed RNA polymerase subunit K/omega